MKNILKLLAVQTFFLFDKNKLSLLLPQTEISLTYTSQIRARILLLRILQASQAKKLISEKVTLWGFTKMIRKDFAKTFKKRRAFLELGEQTLFPYPEETFLLDEHLTITEDMVKKEIPVVAPVEDSPELGVRLVGVEIDHDNTESYRQFEIQPETQGQEQEVFNNPV